MSLIEKATALADGFRSLYGNEDKYSFADMRTALSGLNIKNYFDEGQSYDSTTDAETSKALTGLTLASWNNYLCGKTVIISCDINWSGLKVSERQGKVGVEFQTLTTDGIRHWNNCWHFPKTESGTAHAVSEQSLSSVPAKQIVNCDIYNLVDAASVKISNIKMVVNPMGGGIASSFCYCFQVWRR